MRYFLLSVFLILVACSARAAPPTNCTATATDIDILESVEPATNVKDSINEERCVINVLQQVLATTPNGELTCSPFTLDAGARDTVVLTTASTITASDVPMISVQDTVAPPSLEDTGVLVFAGTTITVGVFNRDAATARTGLLCAHLVQP